MKYTSEYINSMSRLEWCKTMAEELNKAGFKARGYNPELRRWVDNYEPYKAYEPETFIPGTVKGKEEIDFLKSIGLLNNGRCPMCGNPINEKPARFTYGHDSDCHFQICQYCCSRGRKSSINPANNSGCLVVLILFPWYMIKSLF